MLATLGRSSVRRRRAASARRPRCNEIGATFFARHGEFRISIRAHTLANGCILSAPAFYTSQCLGRAAIKRLRESVSYTLAGGKQVCQLLESERARRARATKVCLQPASHPHIYDVTASSCGRRRSARMVSYISTPTTRCRRSRRSPESSLRGVERSPSLGAALARHAAIYMLFLPDGIVNMRYTGAKNKDRGRRVETFVRPTLTRLAAHQREYIYLAGVEWTDGR